MNKKVQISIFKKLHKFNKNICFVTQHFLTQHSRHLFLEIKKKKNDTVLERISFKYNWFFFLVMFVTLIKPFHGIDPNKNYRQHVLH